MNASQFWIIVSLVTVSRPYPTEITDEQWAFATPYHCLIDAQLPQPKYDLCVMCNGLHWIVRAGVPWRLPPSDFSRWEAVSQQTQHWLAPRLFQGDRQRLALDLTHGTEQCRPAQQDDFRCMRTGYNGYRRKKKRQGTHHR